MKWDRRQNEAVSSRGTAIDVSSFLQIRTYEEIVIAICNMIVSFHSYNISLNWCFSNQLNRLLAHALHEPFARRTRCVWWTVVYAVLKLSSQIPSASTMFVTWRVILYWYTQPYLLSFIVNCKQNGGSLWISDFTLIIFLRRVWLCQMAAINILLWFIDCARLQLQSENDPFAAMNVFYDQRRLSLNWTNEDDRVLLVFAFNLTKWSDFLHALR